MFQQSVSFLDSNFLNGQELHKGVASELVMCAVSYVFHQICVRTDLTDRPPRKGWEGGVLKFLSLHTSQREAAALLRGRLFIHAWLLSSADGPVAFAGTPSNSKLE